MTADQFKEITDWQKITFPGATPNSKVAHLVSEVIELDEALARNDADKRLEFADCFLLLFGAAAADGMSYYDVCNAISEKFEINKKRNWGLPDEKGVVNHIKED